ncbi:MAG: hypothetical protein JWP44_4175 [Mucilaginibacter sp.]|nr:hypothetical protein [Mucilaginibacter sp.]
MAVRPAGGVLEDLAAPGGTEERVELKRDGLLARADASIPERFIRAASRTDVAPEWTFRTTLLRHAKPRCCFRAESVREGPVSGASPILGAPPDAWDEQHAICEACKRARALVPVGDMSTTRISIRRCSSCDYWVIAAKPVVYERSTSTIITTIADIRQEDPPSARPQSVLCPS